MRKIIAVFGLLLLVPALLSPQDGDRQYRVQGYIFMGAGGLRDDGLHANYHVGGGGEVLLVKGLGVGAELGAMGRPGNGVGLLSVNPAYHFRHASSKTKLSPFVEGGYTRSFDANDFQDNLFNYGGGIHYWALRRVGLRLEFRDHVEHINHGYGLTNNYWGVRIGLALR